MTPLEKLKPQCRMETMIEAVEARKLIGRRNRRARRKDKSLKKLLPCSSENRCQTEACPICRLLFRRNLARECKRLGLHKAQFTRVSFVPEKMLWQQGELHKVNITRCNEALRKRLERSGIANTCIMIGGLDLSFNTFENEVVGWQWHYYLLINAANTPELQRAFTDAIKPDPAVARPFSFKAVKHGEFLKCLTYAYKNDFYKRSGYFENRLKKDGTPRKRTSSQKLSGLRSVELASWLAGYQVGARLFLRNIRRAKAPNGAHFTLNLAKPIRDEERICPRVSKTIRLKTPNRGGADDG